MSVTRLGRGPAEGMEQHGGEMMRRMWFSALASLVSPSYPADTAGALVKYLPGLLDLPDAAFCDDTLMLVAQARHRGSVPTLQEVRRVLLIWQRRRSPVVAQTGMLDRVDWMVRLAHLTSPSFPADAVDALLGYLEHLTDFPDKAWTFESLGTAARAKRRQAIPALDEVHGALREWWVQHRPLPRAIPAPSPPPPGPAWEPMTPAQIAANQATVQGIMEGVANRLSEGRGRRSGPAVRGSAALTADALLETRRARVARMPQSPARDAALARLADETRQQEGGGR